MVRSTHAETFPSFLRAKPLKINLGWEERDSAGVGGPRKTKRGHEICRLRPGSTKHPDFFYICEHLGLSGWICVIRETTPAAGSFPMHSRFYGEMPLLGEMMWDFRGESGE